MTVQGPGPGPAAGSAALSAHGVGHEQGEKASPRRRGWIYTAPWEVASLRFSGRAGLLLGGPWGWRVGASVFRTAAKGTDGCKCIWAQAGLITSRKNVLSPAPQTTRDNPCGIYPNRAHLAEFLRARPYFKTASQVIAATGCPHCLTPVSRRQE